MSSIVSTLIEPRDAEAVLVEIYHLQPWGPLFFNRSTFGELVSMCVMFPRLRELLSVDHADINDLNYLMDVRAVFGVVPCTNVLQMLIEAFQPLQVKLTCAATETFNADLLSGFGESMRFEVHFTLLNASVQLLQSHFHCRSLYIVMCPVSPAYLACRTILASARGVTCLELHNGVLDDISMIHLRSFKLTNLVFHDLRIACCIDIMLFQWLIDCTELECLTLNFEAIWETCPGVRGFVNGLLLRINSLPNLYELEITIGGAHSALDGLLALNHLRRLLIHLEVHCSDVVLNRLVDLINFIHLEQVEIQLFCGLGHHCSNSTALSALFRAKLTDMNGTRVILRHDVSFPCV